MATANGDTSMSPEEILAIGVRMHAIHGEGPTSAGSGRAERQAELAARVLGILATARRPTRVFCQRAL